MTDYTLEGLSPRSFEHLVQALAVRHLGPGCGVWGDGPDGGRELTFETAPEYRRQVAWDGPGVLQAKFRQRPRRDDGAWAVGQLTEELATLRSAGDRRPPMRFYLFVTNVVLSPVAGTGAKDRCLAALAEAAGDLGLVDYDVWDYDKLRTFLDDAADIRRAYRAWITPGDVLADLVEGAEAERQRVTLAVTRFLQKQCTAEQYARLEQSGTPADERVPIAQVFTDLPLEDIGVGDPGTVLGLIGDLARERHDLSAGDRGAAPSRLVLVGGPGQGKTTVGQFACQIGRAALLRDRSDLTPEVRDVVEEISAAAEALPGGFPPVRRLPFHVPLSGFAERLAAGTGGLIEDLVERIATLSGTSFSLNDMNTVLRQYPILLVLDGLDEVPASSNRERVMQAISAFWTDCATVGADVLCVATTRPQGYTDDFDPRYYAHATLAPLDEGAALAYADRLVRGRFGADADRVERALDRLRKAAGEEMTARLMTTPLQVTIMAYLVDVGGPPPRDRWNLFAAYYEVIYKRESERDNELAAVLRDHKVDVDDIHAEVGLALQVISERTGGTEARISIGVLEELVAARLTSREHPPEAVARLTRLLIDAARQRLVFLVGPEEDAVGFEIRSLQEFMAARALMAGRESKVNARIAAIAPVALWRNVLLFAVGKMVVDREELLVDLHDLCLELGADRGTTFRVAGVGALIALDVLADGSIRQHPKRRRRFTEVALGLVRAGDVDAARRLAPLLDDGVADIVEREVAAMVASGDAEACVGVVALACASAEAFDRWGPLLAAGEAGLTDVRVVTALAEREPGLPEDATALLERVLRRAGPAVAVTAMERTQGPETRVRDPRFALVNGLAQLVGTSPSAARPATVAVLGLLRYEAVLSPVGEDDLHGWTLLGSGLGAAVSADPRWRPLVALVGYCREPSARTLAEAAAALADDDRAPAWIDLPGVPWPLRQLVGQGHDLRTIATEAPAGRFGDTADWEVVERQWRGRSTAGRPDLADLRPWDGPERSGWPLHRLLSTTRFEARSGRQMAVEAGRWLDLARQVDEPAVAGMLADAALVGTTSVDGDEVRPGWTAEVIRDALAIPGRRAWLGYALASAAGRRRRGDVLDGIDGDLLRAIVAHLSKSTRPVTSPRVEAVRLVDAFYLQSHVTGDPGWLALVGRVARAEADVARQGIDLTGVEGVDESFLAAVDAHRGDPGALVRLAAVVGEDAGGWRGTARTLEEVAPEYDRDEVDAALDVLPVGAVARRVARAWTAGGRSGIDARWGELALPASAGLAIGA